MRTVTINYSNFWGTTDKLDAEYFYRMFPAVRDYYDVKMSGVPDFMLYSVYGYITDKAPQAKRILISCEGGGDHFKEGGKLAPGVYDPDFFHYGLTCWWNNEHPNHTYMPPPLINVNLYNGGVKAALVDRRQPSRKHIFCNFIYSNGNSMDRITFKNMLSHQHKGVHCPGPAETNVTPIRFTGYNKESYLIKQAYQSHCKFSIAFENCYSPGYTTEKLSDPLIARSVPIYHGNYPHVQALFNPDCFIHVDLFKSFEEAIEHVIYVDQHPVMYESLLDAPVFLGNSIPYFWDDQYYAEFWNKVFG